MLAYTDLGKKGWRCSNSCRVVGYATRPRSTKPRLAQSVNEKLQCTLTWRHCAGVCVVGGTLGSLLYPKKILRGQFGLQRAVPIFAELRNGYARVPKAGDGFPNQEREKLGTGLQERQAVEQNHVIWRF